METKSADFFGQLKEKYDDFVDGLEDKGVPAPRVLVPLLMLIILLGAAFLLTGGKAPGLEPKQAVSLSVKDVNDNRIAGVKVTLFADGNSLGFQTTDDEGIVKFDDVPSSAKLSVTVLDANGAYKPLEKDITVNTRLLQLQSEELDEPKVADKPLTIIVQNSASSPISGAQVKLAFDNGTVDLREADIYGQAAFYFEDYPAHVTLIASAEGYVSQTRSLTVFDYGSGFVSIKLESKAEKDNADKDGADTSGVSSYGEVSVFVSGRDGAPADGVNVKLSDAATYSVVKAVQTDASGIAFFDNVLLGRRFLISTQETQKFLASSEAQAYVATSSTIPLQIDVVVDSKLSGDYVDLQVIDVDGVPIDGAQVYLFRRANANSQAPQTAFTSANGKASFSVSPRTDFYLTAYAQGYLPGSLTTTSGSETRKISLERETPDNSAAVNVSVTKDGEPIDGAQVALYDAQAFFLGIPPASTSFDGVAVFTVPLKRADAAYKLYAKASKESSSGESGRATMQEELSFEVSLIPTPGRIEISLLGSGNEFIADGAVGAVDSAGAVLATCVVKQGKCSLSVPSETEFQLEATSQNYVQTTTSIMTIAPSEVRSQKIYLVARQAATGVSAKFLGISNADGTVKEVGNAQSYVAKFLVTLPSQTTMGGFHLHLSSDLAKIGSFSGSDNAYASSSYAQSSCYSGQSNSTGGSYKTIDILFPQGFTGSREVSVRLDISPQAPASSQFALNYKAYAIRNNVLLTSPTQAEFKSEDTDTSRAKANSNALPIVQAACRLKNFEQEVKVTSSPLICNDDASFCAKLLLEKGAAKSRSSLDLLLGDEFTLSYDVLSFEAIDSLGIKGKNVQVLSSQAGTVFANEDSARAAAHQKEETRIAVAIEANQRSSGTIELVAIRAANSAEMQATFYSENTQHPYRFLLKITGDNQLKVSVTPKDITAGEDKKLTFRVLDQQDKVVTDALVTLYDCESAPLAADEPQVQGDGTRDFGQNGQYRLLVSPPSVGKIAVRVEQEEFKTFDQCLISVAAPSDSLDASPSTLSFRANSSAQDAQFIEITSTLGVRSKLTVHSDCMANSLPLLQVSPASSTLTDSQRLSVSLIPGVSARTNCQIIARQEIGASSVTKSIPVSIFVSSPADAGADAGAGSYTQLPSTIYLYLDELGFADAYYSLTSIPGTVNYCEITGTEDFQVTASCTSKIAQLTADYTDYANLTKSYRKSGKLRVYLSDGTARTFTVVVSAKNFASGTGPNLPSYGLDNLPGQIYLEIDPQRRYSSAFYSLSGFGESVSSCSFEGGLGYSGGYGQGLYIENPNFCTSGEQRIRVIADFTSPTAYSMLLERIFQNNPYCVSYYSNTFNSPQVYGDFPGSRSPQQDPNYLGSNQFYRDYDPYRTDIYGGANGRITSTGLYPGDYWDGGLQAGVYGSIDYRCQSGGSCYGGPQGALYDQQYLYSNANLRYTGLDTPNTCFPQPFITYLLVNQRRIPVYVSLRGLPGMQQGFGNQRPPLFNNQQLFSSVRTQIGQAQAIEIDPFSLERYVRATVNIAQGAEQPLCKIDNDANLYLQVKQSGLTISGNPAGGQLQCCQTNSCPAQYAQQCFSGHSQYPFMRQPNMFNQPCFGPQCGMPQQEIFRQQVQIGSGATTLNALDATGIDFSSRISQQRDCSIENNVLATGFLVKLNKADVPANGEIKVKEGSAYLHLNYFASGAHDLHPLKVTMGDIDEYAYEPLDHKNLQLALQPSASINGDAKYSFKLTSDYIQDNGCTVKIDNSDDATATVASNYLASLSASFDDSKQKYYKPVLDVSGNEFTLVEASADDIKDPAIKRTLAKLPFASASAKLSGALSCETVKGKVSSNLHFAGFADEYQYTGAVSTQPKVELAVIPLGELSKQGANDIKCEVTDSKLLDEKDDSVVSCEVTSDGKVAVHADYAAYIGSAAHQAAKLLFDTIELKISTVTTGAGKVAATREIRRTVVENIAVKITDGQAAPGTTPLPSGTSRITASQSPGTSSGGSGSTSPAGTSPTPANAASLTPPGKPVETHSNDEYINYLLRQGNTINLVTEVSLSATTRRAFLIEVDQTMTSFTAMKDKVKKEFADPKTVETVNVNAMLGTAPVSGLKPNLLQFTPGNEGNYLYAVISEDPATSKLTYKFMNLTVADLSKAKNSFHIASRTLVGGYSAILEASVEGVGSDLFLVFKPKAQFKNAGQELQRFAIDKATNTIVSVNPYKQECAALLKDNPGQDIIVQLKADDDYRFKQICISGNVDYSVSPAVAKMYGSKAYSLKVLLDGIAPGETSGEIRFLNIINGDVVMDVRGFHVRPSSADPTAVMTALPASQTITFDYAKGQTRFIQTDKWFQSNTFVTITLLPPAVTGFLTFDEVEVGTSSTVGLDRANTLTLDLSTLPSTSSASGNGFEVDLLNYKEFTDAGKVGTSDLCVLDQVEDIALEKNGVNYYSLGMETNFDKGNVGCTKGGSQAVKTNSVRKLIDPNNDSVCYWLEFKAATVGVVPDTNNHVKLAFSLTEKFSSAECSQ